MLLFQSMSMMPWWVSLIAVIAGLATGIMAALPWRSAAEAAKTERDIQRDAKNRLLEETTQLKADVAVLKAKTDLNGLKAEMVKALEAVRTEFRVHSDQDLAAAKDHIAAIAAVNTTLEALREQLRK